MIERRTFVKAVALAVSRLSTVSGVASGSALKSVGGLAVVEVDEDGVVHGGGLVRLPRWYA